MARLRTFVAVDLGNAIRSRLVALQEKLSTGGDMKWVEDIIGRRFPNVCQARLIGVFRTFNELIQPLLASGGRLVPESLKLVQHEALGGRPLTSGSALSRRNREFRQGGVTRCP